MNDVAIQEGREALRLDALTPHVDRKLNPGVRQWLQSHLPTWEKAGKGRRGGLPSPGRQAARRAGDSRVPVSPPRVDRSEAQPGGPARASRSFETPTGAAS